MSFKHACFISYSHGKGDLIKRFVAELRSALTDYLDTFLDEDVYTDERLVPGYLYNEALAQEICASVCMIVVYVPKYERHEYCRREFAGMQNLEQTRLRTLEDARNRKYGLIIPAILEGAENLPEQIKSTRQYADFSKFSTTSPELKTISEFAPVIREIARYVNDLYELLDRGQGVCRDCDCFKLPQAVGLWRETRAILPTGLPLRNPQDELPKIAHAEHGRSPFPWDTPTS